MARSSSVSNIEIIPVVVTRDYFSFVLPRRMRYVLEQIVCCRLLRSATKSTKIAAVQVVFRCLLFSFDSLDDTLPWKVDTCFLRNENDSDWTVIHDHDGLESTSRARTNDAIDETILSFFALPYYEKYKRTTQPSIITSKELSKRQWMKVERLNRHAGGPPRVEHSRRLQQRMSKSGASVCHDDRALSIALRDLDFGSQN